MGGQKGTYFVFYYFSNQIQKEMTILNESNEIWKTKMTLAFGWNVAEQSSYTTVGTRIFQKKKRIM